MKRIHLNAYLPPGSRRLPGSYEHRPDNFPDGEFEQKQ